MCVLSRGSCRGWVRAPVERVISHHWLAPASHEPPIDVTGADGPTWYVGKREEFGEIVAYEWVEEAVRSEAFSRRIVEMVWNYVFRRPALSCEADEFEELRRGFHEDGRNVESMLHRLILTDAYGVP